jgi:hypothetical protein
MVIGLKNRKINELNREALHLGAMLLLLMEVIIFV